MEKSIITYVFFGPSNFFPISEPVWLIIQSSFEWSRVDLTAKLDTQNTLKLGEDLRIGNGFTRLIVLDYRKLLVSSLSEFLLR